jgi:hypothetical protein
MVTFPAKSKESNGMTTLVPAMSRSAIAAFVTFGLLSAADLSSYRGFRLGTDLPEVLKQAHASSSQVTTLHTSPALIQELESQPQRLGMSSRTDPVKQISFSFYNGELIRITINYDRHETEGLTTDDYIEAISAMYGNADRPTSQLNTLERYGDEEIVAQWQDSQYRFYLIRSAYGPTFKLVGVLKKLEEPSRDALREAARAEYKEAPQREAEPRSRDDETEKARLEKARLTNKPAFRP